MIKQSNKSKQYKLRKLKKFKIGTLNVTNLKIKIQIQLFSNSKFQIQQKFSANLFKIKI